MDEENKWIRAELSKIVDTVQRTELTVVAFKGELNSLREYDSRNEKRAIKHEEQIKDLRESKIKDNSKWLGPKGILVAAAMSAPLMFIYNALVNNLGI